MLTTDPTTIRNARAVRDAVERDIVTRSLTFPQSVTSVAEFLGVKEITVNLAIAIANDADERGA